MVIRTAHPRVLIGNQTRRDVENDERGQNMATSRELTDLAVPLTGVWLSPHITVCLSRCSNPLYRMKHQSTRNISIRQFPKCPLMWCVVHCSQKCQPGCRCVGMRHNEMVTWCRKPKPDWLCSVRVCICVTMMRQCETLCACASNYLWLFVSCVLFCVFVTVGVCASVCVWVWICVCIHLCVHLCVYPCMHASACLCMHL